MTVCQKVCSQNRSDNAFTCVTPLLVIKKTYLVWQSSNLQGKTLRLQFPWPNLNLLKWFANISKYIMIVHDSAWKHLRQPCANLAPSLCFAGFPCVTPHNENETSYKYVGSDTPSLKFEYRTFDRLPYTFLNKHYHFGGFPTFFWGGSEFPKTGRQPPPVRWS